nr:MAG TPA: hypothetical protein [Caudoviricetes sp.]
MEDFFEFLCYNKSVKKQRAPRTYVRRRFLFG